MTEPSAAAAWRAETTALVKAFLSSATSAFASLVKEPGSVWSVTVEQATGKGLVETRPEDITNLFLARGTFRNAWVSGEIEFGDREYYVNTLVGQSASQERYGLWEWADALGRPELVPRETDFVRTIDRMETIVAAMARAVTTLQGAIAAASPDVIVYMEKARASVRAAFEASLQNASHRRVAVDAAEAFRRHDFSRVVALLEPLRDALTPAERKKFAYAKRQLCK